MLAVIDIETEGLVNPQKLWVVVVKEVESGKTHVFENLHLDEDIDSISGTWAGRRGRSQFANVARQVTGWIGHNIIGFDLPVLQSHFPDLAPHLDSSLSTDTLVCSRLFNANAPGGHSLDAWGQRLKSPKILFKDFSKLSLEMIHYCKQDIEVSLKIYLKFLPYLSSNQWTAALRLEHDMAQICEEMHKTGFHFDLAKATAIAAGLSFVSPHVFRHSAAVWMAEGGVPMEEIAQFLGHSDVEITRKVYARYSPDYLQKAAKALEL